MRRHRLAPPLLAIIFAILSGLDQAAGAGSSAFDFESVLKRSNQPAPPPYRALRRMESNLTEAGKQGWLRVWTEFRPGQGLHIEVVDEGGSEYVRNKILRGVLNTEQELLAAGRRLRASLEPSNYSFADDGVTDSGLRRVAMKPVKTSEGVVNGRLFFDPASQVITRIEGRLVKSPSFWIRDVDVTWSFAQIGGHLVPTEMVSTGRVRFFGRSTFRMVYEYQTVDGRPVRSEK